MKHGEGSTRRRPQSSATDEYDELDGDRGGERDETPRHAAKRRKAEAAARREERRNQVRDDLPLDAFQANYTSEDNASFVQIVDEENRRRQEEKWGWAWEAERKANARRIEGEEKRKMILDQALSGQWRVGANGQKMIGGLAEGGRDRAEGEAWKDSTATKLIAGLDAEPAEGEGSKALVTRKDGDASKSINALLEEKRVPPEHPLFRALTEAGLPSTALVSVEDGAIVPSRENTSGGGDGRGRGDLERADRSRAERDVLGDDAASRTLSLGGSGVDQWKYKVSHSPVPCLGISAARSVLTTRRR